MSKKPKITFKNIESPPVRATGISMHYSPVNNLAVFTFSWNPPEEPDTEYIASRIILHWDMVEDFSDRIQSFITSVNKSKTPKKAEKKDGQKT
ncbi:MAG: hypothetical protein ABI348_05440 [Nitrososphaera sp.]